jgi:small subunit ribosomal protein S16
MALKIRLSRKGTNKTPFFRVVVQDGECPRDGKFKEIIGTYDPRKADEKDKLVLKRERYDYWYGKGARPTKTLGELVKRQAA